MNPMNKLPADPEWIKLVDEIAQDAAKRLGCLVVMVALQEPHKGGKALIACEGVPDTGPLHEMSKDPPGLIAYAAYMAHLSDQHDRKGTKQ